MYSLAVFILLHQIASALVHPFFVTIINCFTYIISLPYSFCVQQKKQTFVRSYAEQICYITIIFTLQYKSNIFLLFTIYYQFLYQFMVMKQGFSNICFAFYTLSTRIHHFKSLIYYMKFFRQPAMIMAGHLK